MTCSTSELFLIEWILPTNSALIAMANQLSLSGIYHQKIQPNLLEVWTTATRMEFKHPVLRVEHTSTVDELRCHDLKRQYFGHNVVNIVNRVALWDIFSEQFCFSCPMAFHQCFTYTVISYIRLNILDSERVDKQTTEIQSSEVFKLSCVVQFPFYLRVTHPSAFYFGFGNYN